MTETTALQQDLNALEQRLQAAADRVEQFRKLIDEAGAVQSAASADAAYGKKELKRLKGALRSTATADEVQQLHARLDALEKRLQDVSRIRPATGSLYLRLFLGRVNLRSFQRADRTKLKDEYNKFKDRTTVLFFLIPTLALVAQFGFQYRSRALDVLFHVWLLYYYVSLGLRENILFVNGSNIRSWWIYHHHLCAVAMVVALAWPTGPCYYRFMLQFYVFCLYQGFAQILQNRYQKARHYALRSLGKVGSMDVIATETLIELPHLKLLLGVTFIAHAFQVYNGVSLLRDLVTLCDVLRPPSQYTEEVPVFVCGVIFVILGVFNFITTVRTMLAKRRRSTQAKPKLQ